MSRKRDMHEEAIPQELLDTIPDVGGNKEPEAEPQRIPVTVDIHDSMMSLQMRLEQAVAEELERAEQSFRSVLADMQMRLDAAHEQMMLMRQERDALVGQKDEYQRMMSALRELVDKGRQ